MGWAVGYDTTWERDIGYGVPSICDHPGCGARIDRGLGYVCGAEPYGGTKGCGLFFCGKHLSAWDQLCDRCGGLRRKKPYTPTPDLPEWTEHKMKDPSWKFWRDLNGIPEEKNEGKNYLDTL